MFDFEKAFVCVFGNSSMVEMNVSTALFSFCGFFSFALSSVPSTCILRVQLYDGRKKSFSSIL